MSVALIAERAKTHGDFSRTAAVARTLKTVLADEIGDPGEKLTAEQAEALDNICSKLARIVCGDPDHADHWRDIAGYALLGIDFDPVADSVGSFNAAIGEIGQRVQSGEEPVPSTGYFGGRDETSGRIVPRCVALSFARLRDANATRCQRWHQGGIEEWSVADWCVAMLGEAGEAANAIKKLRRIETGAANLNEPGRQLSERETAIAAIGEELADTLIYLDLLALRLGIDLERAVVDKFNKVSERYGFPERL